MMCCDVIPVVILIFLNVTLEIVADPSLILACFRNPFALGSSKPNSTVGSSPGPYFSGPYPVVGLDKGWCISMTGGNDCGEWEVSFFDSALFLLPIMDPY